MARPQKQTVDYFPHDANASDSDTLTILQGRWGSDGYAFWFRLLEKLANSEGHVIDCRNPFKWQLLLAKTQLTEETGEEMMKVLTDLNAIDPELWSKHRLIWCQSLVDDIADVYKNRRRPPPVKPIVTEGNAITTEQSKLKETKVKNTKSQALKKEPDPLNELRGKVFEGLRERRGNKSPVPGAEAKAITWMLKQDYTVEVILNAYDVLKRDKFWADKFLSMQSVKTQVGLIKAAAAELQRVAKGECGSPTQTVDCGTGEAQLRNLHYCKRAVSRIAIINSSYIGTKAGRRIYNLGVDKIAQYHRLRGDEVYYAGPWVPMMLRGVDKVYFSVIFTWDLPDMIRQVRMVRAGGKEVEIGGPAATFMHKYIHTQTGIEPHQGLDDRFEHIPPLSWLKNYRPNMTGGDYKLTFSSRGCPHRCPFCGVKRLEPVALEYDDFPMAPMIGDNNILATSWKHQELVVNRFVNFRGKIDINSGFDMRFFTKEHLKLYSRLRLAYWRFAFDSMEVEDDVRRVAAMMRSNGLDRHQVTFYCLIGFPGTTPEECLYRLNTLIGLGLNPYPMRFWPLNSLDRKYVAPGWTENLLQRMTAYFQTPYLWKSVPWENYRPGKKT